ncbi:protein TASOR 2 isoform X1 [Embiotoca jacksoni]|uniref:protein TASOR 2 isoform X1 n=1 Tax=Embiotoca jacksoni TaxID=100190 RepID=UPI003704BF26
MESGNGRARSKGVLIPVSDSSDVFRSSILAPLQSAYLFEESKQSFRYKSAVLVQNPQLEEKYNAFRAKRREEGYSEEDLQESFGFLLFDDVNKANALGESGVRIGNSTCTTLGDPSKGVYISMYSDCLDPNRWYHGKSGYIAIIRLTKGKAKKVLQNYTQDFTAPTEGFDCHVSVELPSVSAKTSSFLAFDSTQYYMYKLLDDGSNKTAECPSATCPFAIVPFSYTDTKTLLVPLEKRGVKKTVCHYLPWRGKLQIVNQIYSIELRSTAEALLPAKLPPVVKVDQAISMSDLRQLLPSAVFETYFTGEAFLEGLYCRLCEFVPSEAEETTSLTRLLGEIREKDLALTIPLNDGGFLILLDSSHFLTYDDTGSSATEVLQGLFVFPDSRVIVRDTSLGQGDFAMSPEILRLLPVLHYAEGEVEKAHTDPSDELCDVLEQHMQSYTALINPWLAVTPAQEVSISADQYDVPDVDIHLYSSPEWTNKAWQSFNSYLRKPASFQLAVSKASEILATGHEEQREDLEDDLYICPSPEEASASPVSMGFSDQEPHVNVRKSVDSSISSTEAQDELTAMPTQIIVPDNLRAGDATKDDEKCNDLTVQNRTDDMGSKNLLTPPTSDDLPAELIVRITSAEPSVSAMSTTNDNNFEFSAFSARAKLQTEEMNSLSDETDKTKTVLACAEVTSLCRGLSKRQKKVSNDCVETPTLQTVKTPGDTDSLNSRKDEHAKESPDHLHSSSPSNIDRRKFQRRKRKFGKLSTKTKKVRSTFDLAVAEEPKSDFGQQSLGSTILMELEASPLRKKTERWDLKPLISECGRILVPFGSVDIADHIKSLKDKLQSAQDEQPPEKMLLEVPVNAHDTVEMEQEPRTSPETAVDETETTKSMDGGNHLQNAFASHVNLEQSLQTESEDCSGAMPLNAESNVQSLDNVGTDTPPSPASQEKRTDIRPLKKRQKGEFLLYKLKSVLLRGKRKTDLLMTKESGANTAQDDEHCLKKTQVNCDSEALESDHLNTHGPNVGVKEGSKTSSVDPLFAYALGLSPKETSNKVWTTENQDSQQRKDSAETKEQTLLDKQPQIIQRPPSIFPRRGRIKTLTKHQGISAEFIKKKWWLHFQTPASFASEKLKNKDCTRDKTVKEKMTSAYSSADALNLLADLALGASNDQALPQPNPALEKEPETSLKKSDLTEGFTSPDQESVLHALLRKPAATFIPPLESPSPSRLVGESELVDVVSKEHSYSLPPSSSLLLGLPGTPFQAPPLSGSTRLLHHHQTMYGHGIKPLHHSVGQEDRSEHNDSTQEDLKKYIIRRQKFRYSRTFVDKEGSVQVTRQWQENYDFNLDSKLTVDSKNKAIIRALHGPWDFSIQENPDEVLLIVHMWVGLFYSRSTARLFHGDSNFPYPCSEKRESLEMSSVRDTSDPFISIALDLSKRDNTVLDRESGILDLSRRNFTAETVTPDPQVNRKETSLSSQQKEASETLDSLKSPAELQKTNTFQCYKEMVNSSEIIAVENEASSIHESRKTVTSQEALYRENTDVPSVKGHETSIPPREEMESIFVEPETVQAVLEIGQVLHSTDMNDDTSNPETTQASLEQKDGMDSSKTVPDREVDKKEGDVLLTDDNDKTEFRDGESFDLKDNPCQEGFVDPSEKVTHKEMKPTCNDDSAAKENSESDVCLLDKAHFKKAALHMSDESTCSLDGSHAGLSIPQIKDNVEMENQEISDLNFDLSRDLEDQKTKSTDEKEKVDTTSQKEPFQQAPHSPQCDVTNICEAEVAFTETDLKMDKTKEGFDESLRLVGISSIGIDISEEETVQPHGLYPQDEVKAFVQGVEEIPFISGTTSPEAVVPSDLCSVSQICETKQPVVRGSESEHRSPPPTMDEKGYDYIPSSSSCSNTSAFSGHKTCENITLCRSSTPEKDELPFEPKLSNASTVKSDSNAHRGLHHDIEMRTQRVLQSINMLLSKSNHTDKSDEITKADIKESLHQNSSPSSQYIPTCQALNLISADFKDKKLSSEKPAVVSASTSQDLQMESSDHSLWHKILPSALTQELRPCSQRPVMAVKPSKSEESQVDCSSTDLRIESPPKNMQAKTVDCRLQTVVTYTTPASMVLEKKTNIMPKGNSEGINYAEHMASTLSSESTCLANDPSYPYQRRDISKLIAVPSSSLSMQSLESTKSSPKCVNGNQGFLTYSSIEKIEQTTEDNIEMDQKEGSDAAASFMDHKDVGIVDGSLILEPQSSLVCTVYNTSRKRSHSFLEKLSQRCLQDDLTLGSMEQECLIFSEQMKQLLKKSKKEPMGLQDTHDNLRLSYASPVTVAFSSLDEQEDPLDHLDSSLVGQKIKVDLTDRKELTDTTKEEKYPQELSRGTDNPLEHAGVSGVTAECARLYEATMHDVCVVKKVLYRPKSLGMDQGFPKTEASNPFDFCDQMKKEVDETFRSNLNAVVRKSCKTKYRFYILVTSDDVFFEETKAQLEAEGHTAIQPSEFFGGEDSSSSPIIILRNEDIAEHICEVPHLLELKKSPGVQFAGIDEPDDVVNLTHQELFTRGGFVMLDRAALDLLSLGDMTKISEILQELSRTGKWKWMLHYRDSRRLKENARLSPEAKKKKQFLCWGQDTGILEVLPYHECDLMSRDQPDYLTCLVRLQVQNISSRHPVFITGTTTDSAFESMGILTITLNSFLTKSASEIFTV